MNNRKMDKKLAIIGSGGIGLHAAIEACAKSNNAVLIQSNERGIEIVNVDEINRSVIERNMDLIESLKQDDVKPFRFTNPYANLPEIPSTVIKGQFKKKRKKNNRKHNKRRK